MLKHYRPEVGLEPIFQQAEGEQWTTRQIFYAVHGRRPDGLNAALNRSDNSPYKIFTAAIYSDEFRKQHPPRILRDYPEKKRIFFVHIPKSAGSDLASHLTSRYPTLNTRLCQKEWATNEEFLQAMKDFWLEAEHNDTIFVTGHNHLALYENWNVLRLDDRIFTVLREPVLQVISQVNYVLTRIFSANNPPDPDTRGWRKLFGVEDMGIEASREEVLKLARRVLKDPGVTGGNIACAFLGGGSYEKAVERLAIHDVEVVDLSTYERWCRERWGITHSRRVNESKKYVALADFSAAEHDYIRETTRLDRQLHDDLLRALRESGTASVSGLTMARSSVAANPPASPVVEPAPAAAPEAGAVAAEPRPAATIPPPPTFPDAGLAELMKGFESLGENCELGLVQRRCGAEPLGLLRFASAPLPKLLDGLWNKFSGMGHGERIEVQLSGNGREYMVLDKAFGFLYHAWVNFGEKTPEEIHSRETRRVPFLVRKLIEDLTTAEKVFVFHGMTPLTRAEADELCGAMRSYGPATLFWVELADADHAAGTVERLAPGLVKGYIDRFAPGEDAHDLSLACWIELCRGVKALVGPPEPVG